MSAIEVGDLTKHFALRIPSSGILGALRDLARPRFRDVAAVDRVSFRVERGEIVAFLGPNGAGKSTTIKILTGILHPTSGQATVLGLTPWRDRKRLAYRIATVFGQRSQLWYHLPPAETFDVLARVYELDRTAYRQRAGQLIDLFEIGPYLRTPVRRLSLGERMRCEVAAALLHRPEVIFLDEPTIGLDVVIRQRIRELIRTLNRDEGTTIFLTSHDAGDVEQVCRRAIVVNHGQIVCDESIATLRRDYLRQRLIHLTFADDTTVAPIDGVGVTRLDPLRTDLTVDLDRVPIDRVVGGIMARHAVADIAIDEPPMEEIIARIYSRQKAVAA